MNLKKLMEMEDELTIVNSSEAFWQALGSNFSQASCCDKNGQGKKHFQIEGNFLIAKEKVDEAIKTVFARGFDVKNQEHRDHLFTLAAVRKAQDQLSGDNNFVSQRTSDFNKHFNISDSLAGKKIAGETVLMPNAKKYLVQKFNLSSTRAKADVIWESKETTLSKAGKLVDLGFKDAVVDPLIEVAGSLYKAAPTLVVAGLTLGTAQIVLRSCGDQKSANILRDNIGASTEAAAFTVLGNGVLENLSHSVILAAPALATVGAYDLAYSKLKPIYDYFVETRLNNTRQINNLKPLAEQHHQVEKDVEAQSAVKESVKVDFTYDDHQFESDQTEVVHQYLNQSKTKPIDDNSRSQNDASQIEAGNRVETRMQDSNIEENTGEENFVEQDNIFGSFKNGDYPKTLNILKRTKCLIDEDGIWNGLRKSQLIYQYNNLENDLKTKLGSLIDKLEENSTKLGSLIDELEENSTLINKLLQGDYRQTLRDSLEMIKAYSEVYEDKNPGSGIKQSLHEFCDHFTRDAILLVEPSKEAKSAAFYCRSYNGLVSFEERIKESLPHMPTGQQVLLAATVIGALYSASAIYKSVTGEEEVYSDYVTNFPDHLFEWLHLDQMYQNLGGGAEITEYFKDFFAGFNLAENSTHLGIAVAPFAAYAQMGSKMFEGIHHAPANYLAYAADLTSSYIAATKATIGGWFGENNPAPAVIDAQESDIENSISDILSYSKSDTENNINDIIPDPKSDTENLIHYIPPNQEIAAAKATTENHSSNIISASNLTDKSTQTEWSEEEKKSDEANEGVILCGVSQNQYPSITTKNRHQTKRLKGGCQTGCCPNNK